MCAKFGSDWFRNVNLYKVQTNKQTNKQLYIHIYDINPDDRPTGQKHVACREQDTLLEQITFAFDSQSVVT